MRVILGKLISDFRHAKGKLVLLVLATALSAWGISGVVYSYFLTERDFEVNFEQTFPADLALVVQGYKPGLEAALLELPEVLDLERREVVYARVKDGRGSFMPIIIWGIESLDDMRYDQVRVLEEQNKVPNQFLVEQNAFFFFNGNQSQVELIFRDSEEAITWDLDGKVHDARQAPARMEGLVYAYTTSIDPLLPYLPNGQRRFLIKTNISDDKQKLEALSDRLSEIVKANGARVSGVTIPEPGEHMHQGIVDGIAFLQQSGGIVLALMGIILLSLILLTWIFPQLSDIGVMKAIGASTRHIFMSYVIVLLGIVSLGVLIGLPLGYTTASLYSGAVAFFQNFEQVRGLLPIPIHLLVILICLMIPLVFGVRPLLKSSKVTVIEALNKVFYIPQQAIFRLSQQLMKGVRLKYSVNNLFRQSQRSLLTLLLLAVGLALYFTAENVDHSIRADLKEYAQTSPYEVVVFLPEKMDNDQIKFINRLDYVETAVPLVSQRVSYLPPDHSKPELSALRTLSTAFEVPNDILIRGQIEMDCLECVYVTGEAMKEQFAGVELGSPVDLSAIDGSIKTYRFNGVVKDMVVVGAPFVSFARDFESGFNGVAFKLNESSLNLTEIANGIDDAFIDEGINIRSLNSVQRRLGGIIGHLDPSFLIIKITGIFTIVLGLMGLIIVLNLTIQERTREIGIMKSVGAPFRKISALFSQEFAYITVFSLVVGMLLSIPVATALIGVIAETIIRHPVPFKNDYQALLMTAGVVLAVQFLLITINNRFKISKNARELLDHHF